MNGLAVRHVDGLLAVSERLGEVAVLMVGVSHVGRISLSFTDQPGAWRRDAPPLSVPDTPIPISRGDELGQFNLSSTVVLLAADRNLELTQGAQVQMGLALWRQTSAATR